MSNKKILSALTALSLIAGMTAVSVSAEDEAPANDVPAPVAEETDAPAPAPTEEAAPLETNAPAPTEEKTPETTAPEDVSSEVSTTGTEEPDMPSTKDTGETTETDIQPTETNPETETTATAQSTEKVSDKLAAPKMGEFNITTATGEGDGQMAVIAWSPVEGADGYQIYRVVTKEGEEDIPVSQSFDVKGTSYQTGASDRISESIKVRAYQIVNGARVYGLWSETKTVYLNGMEAPSTTTTKKSTSSEKTSTTTTTKTTSSENKTESPKTGDSTNLPAVAATAVSALLAGLAVKKKRK